MVEKSRVNLRISILFGAACCASAIVVACGSSSSDGSPATNSDGGSNDAATNGDAITTATDASADAGADANVLFGSKMTSGSRIKGVYFETADGISTLVKLHDTQLDIDCAWGLAADGALRCLPTQIVEETFNGGLTYLDSACTLPAFAQNSTGCVPQPKSYVTATTGTCPAGSQILAVGAPVATPTTIYERNAFANTCQSAGAPQVGNIYYPLTEVGQANFVEGHDVSSGSGPLAALTIAGTDGSISFRTLHDQVNDVDCTFENATDGTKRCLPVTPAQIFTDFVDSNCTIPAAQAPASACNALAYARGNASQDCKQQIPVSTLGVKISKTFSGSPGSCSPSTDTGPDFFTTAGLAAPTSFVLGTEANANDTPTTRLRRKTITGGSVTRTADVEGDPTFFDTMRNEACLPIGAADGKIRCIPLPITQPSDIAITSSDNTQFYGDAACTTPIAFSVATPCDPPAYAFAINLTCATFTSASVHIYKITGPHTGIIAGKVGSGPCTVATLPANEAAYEIGPEIPASSFVELTQATR